MVSMLLWWVAWAKNWLNHTMVVNIGVVSMHLCWVAQVKNYPKHMLLPCAFVSTGMIHFNVCWHTHQHGNLALILIIISCTKSRDIENLIIILLKQLCYWSLCFLFLFFVYSHLRVEFTLYLIIHFFSLTNCRSIKWLLSSLMGYIYKDKVNLLFNGHLRFYG